MIIKTTRKISVVFLVIAAFVLTVGVASAADYYVATTGNDTTGNGSIDNPWRTIKHAVNNASANDIIIVRDGTYTENLNVVVNVDNLTIRSENGSANCIVTTSSTNKHVFKVTADYVNITGFTVQGAGSERAGIFLTDVEHCTISENIASNNDYGIYLKNTNRTNLKNNTVIANNDGIYLLSSSNNTIANNTMLGNGMKIAGDQLTHWNTHSIDTSNTVNGKPAYYWKDRVGGTVPLGAGQVILANCTNVMVENQNVSNQSAGISLGFSSNNTIANNTANSNYNHGILLWYSNGNNLTNNTANSNTYNYGIFLSSSNDNNLTNNTALNNNYGISLDSSSNNNNLTGNNASNNYWGIHLSSSSNNNLTNNTASDNCYGIYLVSSSNNNNLTGNTANSNTYKGIYLGASGNNNLAGNTANSDGQEGIRLSSSSNNTITNNTASDNNAGIFLFSSSNNNILTDNTVSNNLHGIDLSSSSNNNLTGNIANSNNLCGVHLEYSSNNNTLSKNSANLNDYVGIYLSESDDNNLIDNTARANGDSGIVLYDSESNTLLDNFVTDHKSYRGDSFDVLLLKGATWTYQDELSFRNYETLELPLTHNAGALTLRLSQHGHDSAYVDYVVLKQGESLYEPATAVNLDSDADICYKLLAPDYDVCDAWNSTLELTWDSVPADTTLVMRAMEEDLGPGHGSPIYYPLLREGRTLSHTLVNDGGIVVDGILNESKAPSFSVFWSPDSPHPDGYTCGWLHADDQYVYAAVEVTADNTADDEDWGALFIMVNGELREFRVAPAETAWGQIGFQYTSAVPYEHRIYEFAIPLNLLNARIGDELHYGFGAYGTVAYFYAGIFLDSSDNNNLTGNRVTDNENGIYLLCASENNITCNAVYKNTEAGFYLSQDSENNTIEQNGIVANWDEEDEGCNFYNGQAVTVNATNNYWGTTVSAEIFMRIVDGWGAATVSYEPFLYEWPPCAPDVPLLEVSKTVWNGMDWVKEVEDAYLNDTVRFNCTIMNIGGVNITDIRFWDILDCSLVFAGSATLKNATDVVVNDSLVLESNDTYTFKPKVLHPIGYFNLSNPEGNFKELCPESRNLYLNAWNDTGGDGNLSVCDQIQLGNQGSIFWAHADYMPYTLNVTNNETGESMYLESGQVHQVSGMLKALGYINYEEVDLKNPNYTYWLEAGWTEACCGRNWYQIDVWNDTDGDGNVSVNDTIQLWNQGIPDEENLPWYTITELTIDLVVSREWDINDFADPNVPLEPGQSITLEYNATDIDCGKDTNTFVAKGLYEGNWTYSNKDFAVVEVPPRPAVETNLTVWNGTAWAKAVTVLVNDSLNFSWMVHNNGSCCELFLDEGTLAVASKTKVKNINKRLAPCSEVNGTLKVPALECGTYIVWWNVTAKHFNWVTETLMARDTVTVTVLCPELEVNKTVWNGTAWVKALDASIGDMLTFNCRITNTGTVNLTQIRFWDILDCSLNFSGNETLNLSGEVKDISLEGTYIFKPRVLHPENLSWDPYKPLPSGPYPVFTELYPNNETWYLQDWQDTNNDQRVSACDQIFFEGVALHCHVENVPYTLLVNNTATNTSIYIDSVLDYESINLSTPNGTEWLEICCCKDRYNLTAWSDTNSSGDLNVGDTVFLLNQQTGVAATYVVEEVTIDLVVSPEWEIDTLLHPDSVIFEPNQTIKIEYNATVVKCGVDNNTFVAKGNYSRIWYYSNPDIVTITVRRERALSQVPTLTPPGMALLIGLLSIIAMDTLVRRKKR